jgi:hypothetical protein
MQIVSHFVVSQQSESTETLQESVVFFVSFVVDEPQEVKIADIIAKAKIVFFIVLFFDLIYILKNLNLFKKF